MCLIYGVPSAIAGSKPAEGVEYLCLVFVVCRVRSSLYDVLITSTGSPTGCVCVCAIVCLIYKLEKEAA